MVAAALALWLAGAPPQDATRVRLDLKEAHVEGIVRVLAQAAGLQAVFDPGIACRLTLSLREVSWETALSAVLRACGLGHERGGSVLRVAPLEKLRAEAESARRLREERAASPPAGETRVLRLSHARAEELAPMLQKLLSPGAQVVYDRRTNTLIVIQ